MSTSSNKNKGQGKGKGRSPSPAPAAKSRHTWRINPRAAIGLGLFALMAIVAVGIAWATQASRGQSELLVQAKKLADDPEKKKDELALSYLKQYLTTRPDDLEALDLRGELLTRSARSVPQLQEAIKVEETVLRLEPSGSELTELGKKTRRRLVNAYLDVGLRVPPSEQKYTPAEKIAKELAAQTKSADDLRLHARTLERLSTPANVALPDDMMVPVNPDDKKGPKKPANPLAEAAREYEKARTLEPGNVEGDEHLARIYLALKQPAKADAVLEDLIKAKPKDAPAYLAAARYYSAVAVDAMSSGRSTEAQKARKRVEQLVASAVEIAPRELEVRLQAAQLALAAKKPGEAAKHLDAITKEEDQKNYQYLTLRGVISLYENKATDAIESWSRGLAVTGGSEADLSWRLAFVLLQLGRVEEGEQLIMQYRRLVGLSNGAGGDVPPTARFLEALKLLKMNEPVKALSELEQARLKMPPSLLPQFHLTFGAACEAVRNEAKALEEYRLAIEADPKFSPPRLARARLLANARRADEAVAEIKAGLEQNPDDVPLITAQARLELDRQRRLPKEKRSWEALQALLDRGRAVAPNSASLAVVGANAMALQGKVEMAADYLARATAVDKADADLWIARAEGLRAMGRLDQALMVLDQAADPKAAGDQASLRIARAKILTLLGRGVEARNELVSDIGRVRRDQRPELWRTLGELYTAQGDAASARNARHAYAEWAKLLPDDPLPRLFVLELALSEPDAPDAVETIKASRDMLRRNTNNYFDLVTEATLALHDHPPAGKESEKDREARLDKAERLIRKIEEDNPKLRYGPLLLGALEQQRNNLAAAAKAYEKALTLDGGKVILPRLVALYNQMGEAGRSDLEKLATNYPDAAVGIRRSEAETAARAGNKEVAEKLARNVVLGDPESLEVRVWVARIFNTLGKPAEAEKTLRELVDKDPSALGPWMALLYFQVSIKDQKAALKTAEQIVANAKNLERPEWVWAQIWRVAGDRDRADKAFEAAMARWPDDPRVGRAAAEYYMATGRPDKSEAVFREALKRDETQRWAARGMALILSSRNADPKSWQAAWDYVRDPAPGGDLPEDRLTRAIVLSRGPERANRDAAVETLTKLVEDLPADLPAAGTARITLVQSLIRTDPAKAAEYAAIDARRPNATPAALTLHATALIAAKQFDEAERQLDRLAVLVPADAATVALRARLLRARGKGAEAVASLERAAGEKIDGPNGEAAGRTIVQALISELNDEAAAARVADKLTAKYPKTTLGVKANVLARQGKREDALKIYMEVMEGGDPAARIEAARNSLALVTRDKFDPASIAYAEKVIDAARAKDPKSADLMAMAGYLRHFQGRYDDEMKIYQDALSSSPEDFTLMNNMAWTLSEGLNKPEEALAQVNEAISKAIVVPSQLYDTRGCIYTRMGKFDEAIRDLELAVRERPSGTTLAHLARAYKKAGKEAEFAKTRDEAKKAGLTVDMLEKSDRAELEPLIFGTN